MGANPAGFFGEVLGKMIKRLHITNFRGIERATIDLSPVTLLTGANNSGKSSIMYALLVLKNIVTNPNQPIDSFFNLQFMNLAGFKENVFLKQDDRRQIELLVDCEDAETDASFGVHLGKNQSRLILHLRRPVDLTLTLDVSFPYAVNSTTGGETVFDGVDIGVTWNGVSGSVSPAATATEKPDLRAVASALNLPIEDLRQVDLVPLRRGFTKPVFAAVPLQQQLTTEDEVATFVVNDRDLEAEVDHYLDKVVGKAFHARTVLGTASFQLTTRDRLTGVVCDLVNDGFGDNQLVFLLCKALRKGQSLVCIEEPEIHMHPSALTRLAGVFVDIAHKKERTLLVSTHSEHFVFALLNQVVSRKLDPKEIGIKFLRREERRTIVEDQSVNTHGQIDGGLKSFYAAELDLMKDFLVSPERA